ncbi:SGNH/GDSL hydrolase family protein [Candidatus Fermentibacteria bacterium]|nr:SGNH/GDSL hydrolase family protein [Candidatus Fermentibacteria bacterium]
MNASRKGRKVLFAAAGVAMALTALELLTRLALGLTGRDYAEFRDYNAWVHRASTAGLPSGYDVEHPLLPYRPEPLSEGVNSHGYRGEEFEWDCRPGVLRIACLGGSTTWDNWYPEALEDRMNELMDSLDAPFDSCEVLNFGAQSWTTVESFVNYATRGVHAGPRIIVVYHAINDALASTIPDGVRPEPDYSHWRTRWNPIPRPVWDLPPLWLDESRLAGLARYALNRAALSGIDPNQLGRCGIRYPYEPGMGESPFDTFGNNLENIIAVALNCSTTVFVVSQFHMTELTVEQFGSDDLARRVGRINDRAMRLSREYSGTGRVFFLDAADELRPDRSLMLDNCHFTPEGYRLLGDWIAVEMCAVLDSLEWRLPEPEDWR